MTRQHDKKSVPWRSDPDILRRLEVVANMMIQGATGPQIASSLGASLRTARRDIARVKQLWLKASEQTIEDRRAASLATYQEVKARLWEEFRRLKTEGKSVINVLAKIAEVEGEITKIEGTRIVNVDLTSKGESLLDIRSLDDARIADQLARLLPETQAERV